MNRKRFVDSYLKKVFRVIKNYGLVEKKDKIFVAVSGGKDSTAALFSLKKFIEETSIDCELKVFHINFDLPVWKDVEKVIKKQAELAKVETVVIHLKDFGISLEEIAKKVRRSICSCCGVIKRYLMNKIPREMGATKIATGHNMDDFIVFFFKNLLSQKFEWIAKFKPLLPSTHPKMLCKIRPLFEVSRDENEKFCKILKIPFVREDVCPYSYIKYGLDKNREKWYQTIDGIEKWNRNFKISMIRAIEKMSNYFRQPPEEIKTCLKCGEPSSQEVCGFCKILMESKEKI